MGQRSVGLLWFCVYVVTACWVGSGFVATAGAAESDSDPEAARTLRLGEPTEGALREKDPVSPKIGRYQRIPFSVDADGPVTIRLTSKVFNAFLAVLDPEDEPIAQDDNSGPGDTAELVLEAKEKISYVILAAGDKDAIHGAYRLEAQAGRPKELTPGQELHVDLAWLKEAVKEKLRPDRKLKLLDDLAATHLRLGVPLMPEAAAQVGAGVLGSREGHCQVNDLADVAELLEVLPVGSGCNAAANQSLLAVRRLTSTTTFRTPGLHLTVVGSY